ncbi:MAG: signal recognition particle-docking protein FtsY [Clostridia bacterium]|nr:signal recognition particle-docking protein FtsY [Clostridia bacterium]MBR3577132.1 signal recognition particle-docking protein FtsY [Clostridia bacterium]
MGFFNKIKQGLTKTKAAFSERVDSVFAAFRKVDEELMEELEEALISADVGVSTSLEIIDKLRTAAKTKNISDSELLKDELKDIIIEMLKKSEEPATADGMQIIFVIGVNGVGKTTSIGKLAYKFKSEGKNVLLAAADTFRAGAIDQLQVWADRCDVPLIKQSEGSDPAAVVYDALSAAAVKKPDVLIVDTAGRLHNKKNLMEELKKMLRIAEKQAPGASRDVYLVLDASTGQNALSQSKLFGEVGEITGIILTKLDGTAKGGVIIAISNEQNIPVKYIGLGESIDSIQDFSAMDFANALFDKTEE